MQIDNIRKDTIDLERLLERLDTTILEEDWQDGPEHNCQAWVRVDLMIARLDHARKLLQNVQLFEDLAEGPSTSHSKLVIQAGDTLDSLEATMKEVHETVNRPQPTKRPSMLDGVPLPKSPSESKPKPTEPNAEPKPTPSSSQTSPVRPATVPQEEPAAASKEAVQQAARDLLLSTPTETYVPFQTSPLPPIPSRTMSTTNYTPKQSQGMAGTTKVQEELTSQLVGMARQLKSNTIHFASSLEKDKAVMEGTEDQLEKNYDKMSATSTQMKSIRSKSWGTTWFVIFAVSGVCVAFFFMAVIIRAT